MDEFETTERTLNSVMDLYKKWIQEAAGRHGGYTALSRLIHHEEAYISAVLARGSLNRVRKVLLKIKQMEGEQK
jgi:hypothetical protein